MNAATNFAVDLVKYPFSRNALSEISENKWVKKQWPLVYIIKNDSSRLAYVGETTNAYNRIKNHFANDERLVLNTITLIGSDRFNKSATLDIESQLIQYLSAENTYILQNGNGGLTHHNYYDKPYYRELFQEIWNRLKSENLVTKSLEEIENSDLFKYSPYKALSDDQRASVTEIIDALNRGQQPSLFVQGSAGTGKTILATYLMKLLHSKLPALDEIEELEGYRLEEYRLLEAFQQRFNNARIGLVVPMTSLRGSLKTVFRAIGGLDATMVIGPSDVVKKPYDILIVDEAHRLARRKNITNYKSFDDTNRLLGLGNEGTQLDWILRSSKQQIFFYDEAQSIRPSDIPKERFQELQRRSAGPIKLTSQMRVTAGNDYINFVDRLLKCESMEGLTVPSDYDFRLFTSFRAFYDEIVAREKQLGLSRFIAGYSWPWISKTDKSKYDIVIENHHLQWNLVNLDWINAANPELEVGCIHTTQGYDLNYAGIIFGKEITYNKRLNRIEIIRENYYDRNGSAGIDDDERLKEYVINIYKTIMYRGIKGTLMYACNPDFRDYLRNHIPLANTTQSASVTISTDTLVMQGTGARVTPHTPGTPFTETPGSTRNLDAAGIDAPGKTITRVMPPPDAPGTADTPVTPPTETPILRVLDFSEVNPYVNAVPLVDIQAAAGNFSDDQRLSELTWVARPEGFSIQKGDFICQVVGESMNKRIPNGSYCFFRRYTGGSRNGKIVLVESGSIHDDDFGAGYTVKEYHRVKSDTYLDWSHDTIVLKPLSTLDRYREIVLRGDDAHSYRIVGVFEKVL
ncbi:MAG: hypothetical protein HLUCCA01_10245 [Bacteroidetes bacterium HLUCCA01]|nr:MAG: hypothetical protein HLUCCA01_10245 [Bacteroidetes bacterium HLUCCA01]